MLYTVTVAATGEPLTDTQLLQLLEARIGATVSAMVGGGDIEATMTVEARTAPSAGQVGIDRLESVCGPLVVNALEVVKLDPAGRTDLSRA